MNSFTDNMRAGLKGKDILPSRENRIKLVAKPFWSQESDKSELPDDVDHEVTPEIIDAAAIALGQVGFKIP